MALRRGPPHLITVALLGAAGTAEAQHYFGGIGKNTWAANEPSECIGWFLRYLSGAQREANECPGDVCACATQGRVHVMNATGQADTYRPFAPYSNETWDLFGVHATNCSFHTLGGGCSLAEVERGFRAELDGFRRFVPLMDINLGLWASSLGQLISAFDRDGVPFFPMRWESNGTTFFSALANPCGTVLIEFISSELGGSNATRFRPFPYARMDFEVVHNVPPTPSRSNPLGLAPLKISRATHKLDEVASFYGSIFGATVLLRQRLKDGGEKLVIKMPDTSTGPSTVHLQFWKPAPGDDLGVAASTARGAGTTNCDGWTVATWEAYLNECLATGIQSPTCGFPKALDFHFSYDCLDPACVLDPIADALTARRAPFRWAYIGGERPWWTLYLADPTGYGIELHYVRWSNPPAVEDMAPLCFHAFSNGTCPGAEPGQCT